MRNLAAALSLLALTITLAACSRSEPAPESVRAVRVTTIGREASASSVEYAAEVRARTESRLAFRVPGKLLRRQVELGDAVKAGQLLAQLDGTDLQLGQDAAQAALRGAQANLDQAGSDLKRARELFAQNFVGAAEVDRRETALKAAQAGLEQARAQAGVQGNQAGYAKLLADAAGVITAVEAEPGAVVGAGTPIVRLAHDGPRDVVFSVPEDRMSALRALRGKGGALQVRLWGDAGGSSGAATPLAATVREVASAADPTTRTYLVKADLGRADARLGQTATVVVPGSAREGVVKLPLAALFEQGGRSSVWTYDAQTSTVHSRAVQVAGAEGQQVLVAGGLEPGMQVVTAGVHVLTQGQKVRLYVEPKAAVGSAAAVPSVAPAVQAASAVSAAQ